MTVDDDQTAHTVFDGEWIAPDGRTIRFVQCDDHVRVESVVSDAAAIHGHGRVIDGRAVVQVVDALGNDARLDVAPAPTGDRLDGIYVGPLGRTPIHLTRHR